MKKIVLITGSFLFCLITNSISQNAKQRAEAIAAELSKEKHMKKEKHGIVKEKHKTAEAKPDIRQNIGSYAGKYEMQGLEQFLTLKLSSDNIWLGEFTGTASGEMVTTARLKEIRIEDALLTGILMSEDGKTQPFEGVFINLLVNGEPSNGIGIKQILSLSNGFVVDRAFYKRID